MKLLMWFSPDNGDGKDGRILFEYGHQSKKMNKKKHFCLPLPIDSGDTNEWVKTYSQPRFDYVKCSKTLCIGKLKEKRREKDRKMERYWKEKEVKKDEGVTRMLW